MIFIFLIIIDGLRWELLVTESLILRLLLVGIIEKILRNAQLKLSNQH